MKAKKLVVLALIAGLVAGSLSVAEAKKKKKKKAKLVPATSTFFLRHDSDDCADEASFKLSIEDAEDVDCQYADNAAWPVLGFVSLSYPAADGVPFKLDATKPITGVVSVRSYFVGVGAGPASVTVQLAGVSGGQEVALGEWSTDYTATPTTTHTFEYEIETDDSLNKKDFTAFTATVIPDGTTVGIHGVVEHDTPPAVINVPTLVKKK